MKKVALIFPGQGAQKVGMGREFFEASPEAKAVFLKANDVLGIDLTKVIFEGPEETLMSTAFCQPAIFTMSMAALAALKASPKFSSVEVLFTAGLSLGEYGALCAAGVLSFEDSLRLLRQRSALMEEAAKANPGKMAAVIGFDKDKLVAICQQVGCEVANYNAPDQIVITGTAQAVEAASQLLTQAGAKRVMPLDVAGAFHSSLMASAAERFAGVVAPLALKETPVRVVSNVTGKAQMSVEEIRSNLPKQIRSSVQWVDSVRFMAANGVEEFIEIGPGKVLKGLIRKIDENRPCHNIQALSEIESLPV